MMSTQRIGTQIQRKNGVLTITAIAPDGDKGGQGIVYETSDSNLFIKVWDPQQYADPPADIDAARKEIERRYRTFAILEFDKVKSLSCLPLEFVYVAGNPAYIMERARGEEMKAGWKTLIALNLQERLRIAFSVADTIRRLHNRFVAHSDIKPANFFFDPKSCTVQVLDVDGGGYWGAQRGTVTFPPDVVPGTLYWSPEIYRYSPHPWGKIWVTETERLKPDYWALATLIYRIVVGGGPPVSG